MNLRQVIDTYLMGRELGDGVLSHSVTADIFFNDDPNTGRIARREFVQFIYDFKNAAEEMGAVANANPFLLNSDIVIETETMPATVWCSWQTAGTDLQGCARVKVRTPGVLHEKIACFSQLPQPQ